MNPIRNCDPLEAFLEGNCEATKAKYAAELANASDEWGKPLDFRYAESLVYFGELERDTEMLYAETGRLLGSRVRFRKARQCSSQLCESSYKQTSLEFA